jgi:hypothetical protein
MVKKQGMALGVTALVIYVVGGLFTFAGIGMAAFLKGWNLFGLGDGRSIGWLFLCVGLCCSFLGVIFMRIFRNRGLS